MSEAEFSREDTPVLPEHMETDTPSQDPLSTSGVSSSVIRTSGLATPTPTSRYGGQLRRLQLQVEAGKPLPKPKSREVLQKGSRERGVQKSESSKRKPYTTFSERLLEDATKVFDQAAAFKPIIPGSFAGEPLSPNPTSGVSDIGTIEDLDRAFNSMREETNKIQTMYQNLVDKMTCLNGQIKDLTSFKTVLEEEAIRFGQITQNEVQTLKDQVATLYKATDHAERTTAALQDAISTATQAQTGLADDHANIVLQLNAKIPKIEGRIEEVNRITNAQMDANY